MKRETKSVISPCLSRMTGAASHHVFSSGGHGDEAKALLLDRHLDNELVFHRVDRAVGNSRYEGMDTKMPIVNSR